MHVLNNMQREGYTA